MMNSNTDDDRLKLLKERLARAYEAEKQALEMQSVSNKEGEAQSMANLKDIQALIDKLESQISVIEGGTAGNVTMFWFKE